MMDPRAPHLAATRRLVRAYIDGLRELEAALTDGTLDQLAHQYTAGSSTPSEHQGTVLARNLQAGATAIVTALALYDGMAQHAQYADQQAKVIRAREQAARPRYEVEPPPDYSAPLTPMTAASLQHAQHRSR
jgi:hypothetical protein